VDLSPEKLLVLAAIALVVLGPDRLPGAARSMGRLMAEFRRITSGVSSEMRDVLAEPRQVLDGVVKDMGLDEFRGATADLRNAFNPLNLATPPPSVAAAGGTADSAGAPGPGVAAGGAAKPPDLPSPPDDPSLN
jgi:sec-independent protein translocase protein TatB